MNPAKIPPNENERIQDLRNLTILDTPITKHFERITRITKALFNVPIVAISLVDQERQWFKSAQGLDVCETSREVSFCAHTISQEEIFIINDTLKDDRFADNPLVINAPHIRFYAGYPIQSKKGNKVGSLCIIDTKPRNHTAHELIILTDMAGLAEDELLNEKKTNLQSELILALDESQRKGLTDSLTRIWNREGIEAILFKQLAVSRTQEKGFGLALVDIDNFKHINDTYGHSAGDHALKHLSKIFIDTLRENDAVGRWGGEEFLIVADIDDKKVLQNILQRVRLKLQNSSLRYEAHEIHFTMTIGLVYVSPNRKESATDLVKIADQALYQGKNSGKNKVVFVG